MSNKFTTTVQQYDNTQDLFIEIPHYILQNLSWEEGDELAWSIKGNQIILTKINNTTQSKEESSDTYDWYTVKEDAIKEHIEELTEHFFEDYDEVYDDYIQATNEENYGDQSNELQKNRTLPPPPNFPHFP